MKLKKQEIIEILKKEILTLVLKPGDLLSEATLTDRFGLSRTPIRDILKQLESEGYIKIYPQRGSLVSYIDLHSVEQVIYLRSTLEKDIFKSLRLNFSLTMAHKLNSIISAQLSCIQDHDDISRFLEQDDIFHLTCYQLTGHQILWNLMQQVNVHYLRYRNLNMQKHTKLLSLVDEHKALLDYLQGSNEDPIDSLVSHHLKSDLTAFEFDSEFESFILKE